MTWNFHFVQRIRRPSRISHYSTFTSVHSGILPWHSRRPHGQHQQQPPCSNPSEPISQKQPKVQKTASETSFRWPSRLSWICRRRVWISVPRWRLQGGREGGREHQSIASERAIREEMYSQSLAQKQCNGVLVRNSWNMPIASMYGIFTIIYLHVPYFTIKNHQM